MLNIINHIVINMIYYICDISYITELEIIHKKLLNDYRNIIEILLK